MAKAKQTKQPKSRHFAFILYPESLSDDWLKQLNSIGLPTAVSPLHDKDVFDKDKAPDANGNGGHKAGDLKKAHYHVIMITDSGVTVSAVRNKINRNVLSNNGSNVANKVEIVDNVEWYYEYLSHESESAISSNKPVYDRNEITLLNGFDVEDYIHITPEAKNKVLENCINIIVAEKFETAIDVDKFLEQHEDEAFYPSVRSWHIAASFKAGYINMYLNGNYQRRMKREAYEKLKLEGKIDSDEKSLSGKNPKVPDDLIDGIF